MSLRFEFPHGDTTKCALHLCRFSVLEPSAEYPTGPKLSWTLRDIDLGDAITEKLVRRPGSLDLSIPFHKESLYERTSTINHRRLRLALLGPFHFRFRYHITLLLIRRIDLVLFGLRINCRLVVETVAHAGEERRVAQYLQFGQHFSSCS